MPVLQKVIAYAVDLLIAGTLTGLVVRRRVAACYFFALQLLIVLVTDLLIVLWPQRFYVKKFWLLKDSTILLLTVLTALELTWRTFRSFPGAQSVARRVLVAILVLTTLVAVLAFPIREHDIDTLAGKVYPRLLNGVVWLFTAIAGLILWYRLPVHPLLKAIPVGFVPYLLVLTVGVNALDRFGWEQLAPYVSYLESLVYLVVVGYWARVAWHPAPSYAQAPAPARAVERPT